MLHDFSKKTVESLYQTIKKNVDEEKQFVIFDYISDLFAEELEIKDYVNNIQEYHKKMFDKHDVTTKKFETILKKVEKLDTNYAAQLETYKGRVDALAKRVLAVSELLAPQKLSLDKTAYADLLKNINLTYQKEVKVQESTLAALQEEALDIDRDWLDKVVLGIYDGMEEAKDYLKRSAEQIVLGNYTDEVTLLGTAGQIVLGIFDLDLLCDIRDLSADAGKLLNGEDVNGLMIVLDVVALIPVIGAVKYLKNVDVLVKGAEAASDVGKIGKAADEIADVGEIIGENADEIGDIGKGISKDADVAVEDGAKSADEVVEGGISSTISETDRIKIDGWKYRPDDATYLKYKNIYDNPKYYNQKTGSINYPGMNGDKNIDGFLNGVSNPDTIEKGTVINRYGDNGNAQYFSPEGTSLSQRALPPGTENKAIVEITVLKDIPCSSGKIAPWFDQPGGGIQYYTNVQIKALDGSMVDATMENLEANLYIKTKVISK